MSLKSNLVLIFALIILLLVCTALFPSPEMIFIIMLLSTILIIYQTFLILMDDSKEA